MSSESKLRRDLIGISALSFICLLLNIGGAVFLYRKSKVVAETIPIIPKAQAVPLRSYMDSRKFIESLEIETLPTFSAGYLLIGLFVLRHCEQIKKIQRTERDA